MILQQARTVVEEFANQTVSDAIITVPAFFNQAERRAITTAAKIADVNLLQVSNSSTLFTSFALFHTLPLKIVYVTNEEYSTVFVLFFHIGGS